MDILYYLVVLGVRTPLLIGGLIGMRLMLRASVSDRNWWIAAPALSFVAILGFAIAYSGIDIGVCHRLILYPALAIGLAYAVLAVLVAAQAASLFIIHPNHPTYISTIAGVHPERFLISADLDGWQDLW